jgi:hypothetical protein
MTDTEIELSAGPHRIAMEYYESQDADAEPGLYGHYVYVGDSIVAAGASRIYRLDEDSGQWNNFGRGNLDIRYQPVGAGRRPRLCRTQERLAQFPAHLCQHPTPELSLSAHAQRTASDGSMDPSRVFSFAVLHKH